MADTTVRNFINGEPVDAADGRRADLIDPSTGEVFGSAPCRGPEDVDPAYRAAADAFETWRDTHPERAAAGAAEVRRRAWRRAPRSSSTLESQNTGKPIELTTNEEIPPADRPDPVLRRLPRGCSRDAVRGSTWPATRPTSGASRSASSGR